MSGWVQVVMRKMKKEQGEEEDNEWFFRWLKDYANDEKAC